MKLLIYLLVNCIAVIAAAYIIPGVVVSNWVTVVLVAVVLGILNSFVRPLLILLTLPITILTLGLFIFVINALLVLLASFLIPGFFVSGFITALLFSIVVSVVSWLINSIVK